MQEAFCAVDSDKDGVIAAKDLEKAIAGLNILVANHPDEVDICKEEIQARYLRKNFLFSMFSIHKFLDTITMHFGAYSYK